MYSSSNENINPSHYKQGGMESIDVIKAFTGDLKGVDAFCAGNAIKYILRFTKKNGIEDVEKAIWYLTYLRDHMSGKDVTRKPQDIQFIAVNRDTNVKHVASPDIIQPPEIDLIPINNINKPVKPETAIFSKENQNGKRKVVSFPKRKGC